MGLKLSGGGRKSPALPVASAHFDFEAPHCARCTTMLEFRHGVPRSETERNLCRFSTTRTYLILISPLSTYQIRMHSSCIMQWHMHFHNLQCPPYPQYFHIRHVSCWFCTTSTLLICELSFVFACFAFAVIHTSVLVQNNLGRLFSKRTRTRARTHTHTCEYKHSHRTAYA